jgi:TolB-like protein/Flp pilus assembly protein TadD
LANQETGARKLSLLGEIKRRNVSKVAMLYIVSSWLLLQVADVLFDALELPAEWDRLVLALVILGFPIAVIFAWVFEMTPEGLKRQSEVDRSQSITEETGRKINLAIIVLLVLAILAVGLDRLMPEAPSAAEDSKTVAAADAAPPLSIAVLPFANRSAREDDVYFVDGMHDDILTQLAKINALTVTSRTSVERFRDPAQFGGIPEIAKLLGVRNILEGGIQRAGNSIRINMQLIDVVDDDHLWAETYNRELTASNLFAVQGEIAEAVATALSVALAAGETDSLQEAPTQSLAAYDLYLLGRHHWYKRTEESISLAKDYFEQAIAEDPNYVPALSGLADSYMLLVSYGNMPGAEAYPVAQEAIDRAMAIDDSVSEVWASLGLLRASQVNFEGAEEAFLRAIELNPKNAFALLWYSGSLFSMRRFDVALETLEAAYALEPMSKPIVSNLADRHWMIGDFDRARLLWERFGSLDEDRSVDMRTRIALSYYDEGQIASAISLLREIVDEAPGTANLLNRLGLCYASLGDTDEARRWYTRAEKQSRGDRDRVWAFEADKDYPGAIAYLEDRLTVAGSRRDLWAIGMLFRESYLAGDLPLAAEYLREELEQLHGRFEVNAGEYGPINHLDKATFLIRHGEEFGFDAQHGQDMVDEYLASLLRLHEQGFANNKLFASLAMAYALQGDSLQAIANLEEAVERGYRNDHFVFDLAAFDDLRDSADFVALTERVETLLAEERAKLAEIEFAPYTPPQEYTPIPMSREEFGRYAGHYSDGNAMATVSVSDSGTFTFQVGAAPAITMLPIGEHRFFFPEMLELTIEFALGDDGAITHFISTQGTRKFRMKRVPAPPPIIELPRATLERYAGTYVHYRRSPSSEERSETDSWACIVSVDENDRIWIDFDDQPILEMAPYSKTEFHVLGFDAYLTFAVDEKGGAATRMELLQDGVQLNFERQ